MKRLIFLVIAFCLTLTACGKAPQPEPQITEPMTTDDLSAVYTDWSKLEPNDMDTMFTYYEPRSEDGELQARDDYGTLMTYLGSVSGYDEKKMYGLMTIDGQVVTEPVYDEISYLGEFIILRKLEKGEVFNEEWNYFDIVTLNDYTIAASDGSWVLELGANDDKFYYTYDFPYQLVRDDLLFYVRDDLSAILLNSMGEIVLDISSSVILDNIGEYVSIDSLCCEVINKNAVCIYSYDDGDMFYMSLITGEVLSEVPRIDTGTAGSSTSSKTTSSSEPDAGSYYSIQSIHDKHTGDEYWYGTVRTKTDYYYEYTYDLLDKDGSPIIKDCVYWMVENGQVGAIRNGYFCYYSIETGELVFSYPIRSTMD